MSVSEEFVQDVKNWVALDDQLRQTRNLATQIRKKKEEVGKHIQVYIESNHLQDKDINLSDGKLKYYVSKQLGTVSRQHIENSLVLFFKGNYDRARAATEFIYSNREAKEKKAIKRTRKKKKNT